MFDTGCNAVVFTLNFGEPDDDILVPEPVTLSHTPEMLEKFSVSKYSVFFESSFYSRRANMSYIFYFLFDPLTGSFIIVKSWYIPEYHVPVRSYEISDNIIVFIESQLDSNLTIKLLTESDETYQNDLNTCTFTRLRPYEPFEMSDFEVAADTRMYPNFLFHCSNSHLVHAFLVKGALIIKAFGLDYIDAGHNNTETGRFMMEDYYTAPAANLPIFKSPEISVKVLPDLNDDQAFLLCISHREKGAYKEKKYFCRLVFSFRNDGAFTLDNNQVPQWGLTIACSFYSSFPYVLGYTQAGVCKSILQDPVIFIHLRI